jgi:dTDP-4-dehydrorhamnose 3,5-epimerase
LTGSGQRAGLLVTPLRRIPTPRGAVLHGMKAVDPGYAGFGEAYFSVVDRGAVKGWKRHQRMVLNLVVCSGAIRFYVRDGEGWAGSVTLSPDDDATHARLTVPAGLWMAFEGVGAGTNMVLNVASIGHDPTEAETRPIDAFALEQGESLA